MAEDSDLERTEDPSPRRLEEARERGQIVRSQELVTFAVLMTGVVGIIYQGPDILTAIKQMMVDQLSFNRARIADPTQMALQLLRASQSVLTSLLPVFMMTVIAAIVAPLLVGGWLFTFEPLVPNFGKLNPVNGLARMFSVHALSEMIKAILKSSLIGGVAIAVLWRQRDEVLTLISMPPMMGMAYVFELVRFTLLLVVGSLALLAALDVPYQMWEYTRGLRMTKEEVRQEAKEAEGDPQLKGRIRAMQREAARKRMMAEIPQANVIVTNPTHYAVALRYEEGKNAAPVVVAKGSYLLAERIIEIGKEHQVAILRAPPLARALYHHAELGTEIPAALYTATAEVLAYVYQLRAYQQTGGVQPTPPQNLPVPPELDPGGEA